MRVFQPATLRQAEICRNPMTETLLSGEINAIRKGFFKRQLRFRRFQLPIEGILSHTTGVAAQIGSAFRDYWVL
jgi:hypothetical protein